MTTLSDELVRTVRGERLADLALNAIEIIDRNLYERSCDCRWWATDSAVVLCIGGEPPMCEYASKRLEVILDSYTVYLDLWVANAEGKVIATGRPNMYPKAVGLNVRDRSWFRDAMNTRDGTEFGVADIAVEPSLGGAPVATYSAGIRVGGETNGNLIGVLGIHFDWETQAQTVVDGVRLSDEERPRTRVMLIDSRGLVIADSAKKGILREKYKIQGSGKVGNYVDSSGNFVGWALTPGYETYSGLGWRGVLVQKPAGMR